MTADQLQLIILPAGVLAVLFALWVVQARVVKPLTVLTDKTVRLSRGGVRDAISA